MCGIVGAWGLNGPVPAHLLPARSLDALRHRGPDGAGWFANAGCRMGFRRLAIIDVEGGDQPLHNENGDITLTINGEIYNHHALRAELAARHRFSTSSDAEVVLHGYEEWGTQVFDRLRGMFALALADARADRLVLARDCVGKKPLYTRIQDGALMWSSEIAPLLGSERPAIDRGALNDYLRFGYVPAPRTLVQGIRKLPAGCMLIAERGRIAVRRWSPLLLVDATPGAGGLEDQAGEEWEGDVRSALSDAVSVRMESEVPLGFLLSGGIDSAAVFALGAQASRAPLRAFTVGFAEPGLDETAAAGLVARRYGAEHVVLRLEQSLAPSLREVVARCEEPLATDALLPTERVFAAVRAAGVTTILAGEGADEVFAGYTKFAHGAGWEDEGHAAWRDSGSGPLARYLATEEFCFPSLEERRELLGEEASDDGYAWLDEAVAPLDPLSQMLAIEVALRLPDRINHRLDRLSMAHGVEARAPFMDRDLMQLALGVPHGLRGRPGQAKRILRRALRDDLPASVVTAPKAPFRAPCSWFLDDGALSRDEVEEAGLVDARAVARLQARASSDPRAREQLYNLLILHLWHAAWYRDGARPLSD